MIHVNVVYKNEKIIELSASGHALFAEAGKDIVCAGVSSVMTGLLNAIDLKTNYEAWMDQETMSIRTSEVTHMGQIICETGLIQLKTIQEQFPNNIKIREWIQ